MLPFDTPIVTVLTMTEVSPDDPAFAHPTKFVGPVYDEETAQQARGPEGLDGQARR